MLSILWVTAYCVFVWKLLPLTFTWLLLLHIFDISLKDSGEKGFKLVVLPQ